MKEHSHNRLKLLWKARARALQELSRRHPDEFLELRQQEMKKMGGEAIRPAAGRPPQEKPES